MIRVEDKAKAVEFLRKHKQYPMMYDITHGAKEYPVYVDDLQNITCVVVEIYPRYYYGVFGTNEKALDQAYNEFFTNPKVWLAAVDERVQEVYKKYGFVCEEICNLYEHVNKCDSMADCPYEVRPIKVKDYKVVKEHHFYGASLNSIKNDAKRNPTSAIYVDGKMVSWCLVHDNMAMGPIFTLPEWRGKGLAEYVTCDLVNKLLENGIKPYFMIVEGNKSSEALSKKVGFERCGVRVGWIHKKQKED